MESDNNNILNSIFSILSEMYQEKIPFNKVLGFQVKTLKPNHARVELAMRDELIGNYIMGTLHGGVISAVLDATGGMMASLGIIQRLAGKPAEEIKARLARVGTIDLRIDYLRPGRGKSFFATSTLMRTGRKVAVTRMEFCNDQEMLLAVGTGTYIIG